MCSPFPVIGAQFRRVFQGVLLVLACSAAAPLISAKVIDVSFQLMEKGRVVQATLPPGTRSVSLQRFNMRGSWQTLETRTADQGVYSHRLSSPTLRILLRLRADVEAPSRKKFPALFYRGRNQFAPTSTLAASEFLRLNDVAMSVASPPVDVVVTTGQPSDQTPQEADIWKIAGSTAYFFNQLRGLQVIDLSSPAEPRLTASLRLPAAGQDLHLLAGSEGRQDVLLITSESGPGDAEAATMMRVVRVEQGTAQVLQSARIEGRPVASRLQGSRLYLCTESWNPESGPKVTLGEWRVDSEAAPVLLSTFDIGGSFSAFAAGSEWLAVACSPSAWSGGSRVAVYGITADRLEPLSAVPVEVRGRIADQYAMQWRAGVLSVAAQEWAAGPTTLLQNFKVDGPAANGMPLGLLELAPGETLRAARFVDEKAYIVTFLQKDPLFVVDLRDPSAPIVSGQLEVPGWSTYIEPLGDRLFTIGLEDGSVMASLFDVSDPAQPTTLKRLNLTEGYGYSESNWDPRALRVLSGAGLALVPLTRFTESGPVHGVRLLDVDAERGVLESRGFVAGRFEPRRAELLGGSVVSLSQRTLTVADIADRDQPRILADELVAWPVNHVVPAGENVFAIEAGGSWAESAPTLRVSPVNEPDTVLAEVSLGEGSVHEAALRGGLFYVLRESGAQGGAYPWMRVMACWPMSLGTLHLDIYDANDPLAIRLVGSCSVDAGQSGMGRVGRLLWPQPNRPAVILDGGDFLYWDPIVLRPMAGIDSIAVASPVASMMRPWRQSGVPRLVVFDVSSASSPTVELFPFGADGDQFSGVAEAGSGLIVTGSDRWMFSESPIGISARSGMMDPVPYTMPAPVLYSRRSELVHFVQVVEVPVSGGPRVRKAIDLPGSLAAVGELSRDGFLAYTRTNAGIQASACDGWDAFQVASYQGAADAVVADGRSLFMSLGGELNRLRLSNTGKFAVEKFPSPSWSVSDLRIVDRQVVASAWRRLFVAPLVGSAPVASWDLSVGFDLGKVALAPGGGWLVPMGDYGYETLSTEP